MAILKIKDENGSFINIPSIKGDKGDKGEKGDAGSVKFIVVNELPTKNIDESAMYLVPNKNPEDKNTYDEYFYTNGQWELVGNKKIEVDLTDYQKKSELEEKGLLITYEDKTTETVKLVVYK